MAMSCIEHIHGGGWRMGDGPWVFWVFWVCFGGDLGWIGFDSRIAGLSGAGSWFGSFGSEGGDSNCDSPHQKQNSCKRALSRWDGLRCTVQCKLCERRRQISRSEEELGMVLGEGAAELACDVCRRGWQSFAPLLSRDSRHARPDNGCVGRCGVPATGAGAAQTTTHSAKGQAVATVRGSATALDMWRCNTGSGAVSDSPVRPVSAVRERPPKKCPWRPEQAWQGAHAKRGLHGRHRPEARARVAAHPRIPVSQCRCLMIRLDATMRPRQGINEKGCTQRATGASPFSLHPQAAKDQTTRAAVRQTSAKSVSKSGLTSAHLKPTKRPLPGQYHRSTALPICDRQPPTQRATKAVTKRHFCLYPGLPSLDSFVFALESCFDLGTKQQTPAHHSN